MIRTYGMTATVTGANGSATGSASSSKPITGKLLAVYVDYTTQPATCDVTVTAAYSDATISPTMTLLTLTDANTDGWFFPRQLVDTTAGVDTTAEFDHLPLCGYVSVAVAQGNAGSVAVLLVVEE